MAGAARAALLLVDVQPVQVQVAVPKAGQAGAGLVLHEVGQVAAETQGVTLHLERRVEPRRILHGQQPEMLGRVRLVARGAAAFPDRTVVVGVLTKQLRHVREDPAVGGFELPVVTFETEGRLRLLLEVGKPGEVGVVTSQTAVTLESGTVNDGGPHDEVLDSAVAGEAQVRGGLVQLKPRVRRVRVVAGRAAIGHRPVLVAGGGALRRALRVAFDAEPPRRLGEQLLVGAGVRLVAHDAGTDHHGAVDMGLVEGLGIVTGHAQLAGRLLHEQHAVLRAVRVVAARAVALVHGSVNRRAELQLVTALAEFGLRLGQPEEVVPGHGVLVAVEATASLGGPVHDLAIDDVGVAGPVGAGLGPCRRLVLAQCRGGEPGREQPGRTDAQGDGPPSAHGLSVTMEHG
jgi:hypothetical protein